MAGCCGTSSCTDPPAAAPGPKWRTEPPPPPPYGSLCRFPDGRETSQLTEGGNRKYLKHMIDELI